MAENKQQRKLVLSGSLKGLPLEEQVKRVVAFYEDLTGKKASEDFKAKVRQIAGGPLGPRGLQ